MDTIRANEMRKWKCWIKNANDGVMCVRKSFIILFIRFRHFCNGKGATITQFDAFSSVDFGAKNIEQPSFTPGFLFVCRIRFFFVLYALVEEMNFVTRIFHPYIWSLNWMILFFCLERWQFWAIFKEEVDLFDFFKFPRTKSFFWVKIRLSLPVHITFICSLLINCWF